MGSRSELYSPLKLAPTLMRNEVLIPSVPVDTDRIGMREAAGGPFVFALFCVCLGFVVYFPLLFPPNRAWPKLYVRVLLLPPPTGYQHVFPYCGSFVDSSSEHKCAL